MLFWVLAAAISAAVVMVIVPPLLRPIGPGERRREDWDLEVYRDQLSELDRDLARGLLPPAQAASAKAEIGRRMLAAAEPAPEPKPQPPAGKLTVALVALVPLAALTLYLGIGHPELPAAPLAGRDLTAERDAPAPDVLAAVEKLRDHLAVEKGDLQGWTILAEAYAKMRRFKDAAEAAAHIVALAPDDLAMKSFYAETLTAANQGTVPEPARDAFEAVLAKDARDPRARYYLALARFQAGDAEGALGRWQALAAETPADAPYLSMIASGIREAAQRLHLDPAAAMPKPLPAERAPGAPNTDQSQAIAAMVDKLAARLNADPSDVEGWLKLARSYGVLGQPDKALAAARQAAERAPTRADAQLSLADALIQAAGDDATKALPAEAVAALRQVLVLEPASREALWLLGLDAAAAGRREEAATLWGRLLVTIEPGDPDHAVVQKKIEALKVGG